VKWIKATDELKAQIENLMQTVECEKRPMFGYPAYFINKNMIAGLFQDKLFLRLSPDQVSSLGTSYSITNLEPMPGRPMKDYFVIPEKLHLDAKKMPGVVKEAAEYCQRLPAKVKKPRKKT
jgi:TfoX/Sxy family transcriptional regulator of competence genes